MSTLLPSIRSNKSAPTPLPNLSRHPLISFTASGYWENRHFLHSRSLRPRRGEEVGRGALTSRMTQVRQACQDAHAAQAMPSVSPHGRFPLQGGKELNVPADGRKEEETCVQSQSPSSTPWCLLLSPCPAHHCRVECLNLPFLLPKTHRPGCPPATLPLPKSHSTLSLSLEEAPRPPGTHHREIHCYLASNKQAKGLLHHWASAPFSPSGV